MYVCVCMYVRMYVCMYVCMCVHTQVVWDERCKESGKYWSWNGGAKTVGVYDPKSKTVVGAGGGGGGADALFANDPSAEVQNKAKSAVMFDLSTKLTGAVWPQ